MTAFPHILVSAVVFVTMILVAFGGLAYAWKKWRGEAGKARTSRDALFEILRKQTSYFRRLGRAAFRDSAARADFDRVHREQKQRKAAPPPAPPAATKAAAA